MAISGTAWCALDGLDLPYEPGLRADPNPTIIEHFKTGDLVCADCGLALGGRIVDTRSECGYVASVLVLSSIW